MIRALTILLGAMARTALAGAPALVSHPFAAPAVAATSAPSAVTGLGEMTLALGAVLAAIFGLAWVARRVRGIGGRAPEALDVLAEVRLGPKERAVLIKVGSAQLLVGVAPGRVNTLHVLAEPIAPSAAPASPAATPPSFRALLLKSLGKS
jgi:flagellar protein FliO/FliZ